MLTRSIITTMLTKSLDFDPSSWLLLLGSAILPTPQVPCARGASFDASSVISKNAMIDRRRVSNHRPMPLTSRSMRMRSGRIRRRKCATYMHHPQRYGGTRRTLNRAIDEDNCGWILRWEFGMRCCREVTSRSTTTSRIADFFETLEAT